MEATYTLSVDLVCNLDDMIIRFIGVYGPTTHAQRAQLYDELKQAKPQVQIPWMLAGDFNVTLHITDRSNRNHSSREMIQFRNLIHSLDLIDLQLKGRQYTWCNEREILSFVRQDRFFISTHWASKFPNLIQRALPNAASDHCPVICHCETKFSCPNSFRIENYWLAMTDFNQLITEFWINRPLAQSPTQLQQKLLGLRKKL
jgi:hypothetical protein